VQYDGRIPEGPLVMPIAVQKLASSPNRLPGRRPRLYGSRMSRGCEDSRTGETGLTQLLADMRSDLLRFMLARQCDPAEVEDLLQDLYVKLTSIRSGPVSNPRAYLYQMANNLLHDHRRGRRRQQERDDRWTRNRIGPDLETDTGPSPEESAIARDELERVNQALASMPARTAQILKMYRLDGVSQKAIADRLNLSLSAVEKHLQRAYRKLLLLREELEGTPQLPQEEADDVSLS
jgi:RNA polymerase sigma factor (sigma-70 family)